MEKLIVFCKNLFANKKERKCGACKGNWNVQEKTDKLKNKLYKLRYEIFFRKFVKNRERKNKNKNDNSDEKTKEKNDCKKADLKRKGTVSGYCKIWGECFELVWNVPGKALLEYNCGWEIKRRLDTDVYWYRIFRRK